MLIVYRLSEGVTKLLSFAVPGSLGDLSAELHLYRFFEIFGISRLQGFVPLSGLGRPLLFEVGSNSCVVVLTLISDENGWLVRLLQCRAGYSTQQCYASLVDLGFGIFLPMVIEPAYNKLKIPVGCQYTEIRRKSNYTLIASCPSRFEELLNKRAPRF